MNRGAQFCGIAGLVVLVFGLITSFLLEYDFAFFIPAHFVLAALLLAAFVLKGGVQALGSVAAKRTVGFGFGVTLYSTLFVSLLVAVNYIASRNEFFRFDSTEQKVYTLAPQTEKILSTLEEKILIRGFYVGGTIDPKIDDLLERIAQRSDFLSWKLIDPEKHPTLVEQFGINQTGTVHIAFEESESSREVKITREITEQEIVNGLAKLTRGGAKTVYYLTGHGEPDLTNAEEKGYLFLKESVDGENIALKELLIGSTGDIPADAAALLVAAPQKGLLPQERKSLEKFLSEGGNAVFLHEPRRTRDIAELVAPLGIRVGEDVIVDQVVQLFSGPTLGVEPVVMTYVRHEITEEFKEGTIFSIAASVREGAEAPEGAIITELALSAQTSWAESDVGRIFESGEAELGEEDAQGPVSLAVAYEMKREETADEQEASAQPSRVVVFGDSDFVNNANIRQLFNRDFFLNALNWVLGQGEEVSIRARTLRMSTKGVTPEQFGLMFLITAILIPELILIAGLSVWWRRRV